MYTNTRKDPPPSIMVMFPHSATVGVDRAYLTLWSCLVVLSVRGFVWDQHRHEHPLLYQQHHSPENSASSSSSCSSGPPPLSFRWDRHPRRWMTTPPLRQQRHRLLGRVSVVSMVGWNAAAACNSGCATADRRERRSGSRYTTKRKTAVAPMFGLPEWRDADFQIPGGRLGSLSSDELLGKEYDCPKPICLLPFPCHELLLPGESKELHLYEDRFLQLFQQVQTQHCGLLAMGLATQSGLVQTVPLCEVESYHQVPGYGVFCTIRCVSRGQLLEIQQQEPYLRAICVEIADQIPPHLYLPNVVASTIERDVLLLSSMEFRWKQAQEGGGNDVDDEKHGKPDDADVDLSEDPNENSDMDHRIRMAKLENQFLQSLEPPNQVNDKEDDNMNNNDHDDDDEEDQELWMDRKRRFHQAYERVMSYDMQGYRVSEQTDSLERTAQELSAMSWAAFCTEVHPTTVGDSIYRIQALDCEKLLDRLKLATYMFRQKKVKLRAKLERSGIQLRREDDNEEEA